MVKILICICSDDIKKLKITVNSLFKLKLNHKYLIEIIIIDNSKKKEIKNFCKNLKLYKQIKIHHFHFIHKRIPILRNKCLKESKKIRSDYTCFVDDDSIIPKNWILLSFKTCFVSLYDLLP